VNDLKVVSIGPQRSESQRGLVDAARPLTPTEHEESLTARLETEVLHAARPGGVEVGLDDLCRDGVADHAALGARVVQ
jgi:hypothetical protein